MASPNSNLSKVIKLRLFSLITKIVFAENMVCDGSWIVSVFEYDDKN